MRSAKPYSIAKRTVWEAYQQVKANRGAAGIDDETIAMFEQNLSKNLYKLWNRMASGSYFPPPVRQVEIPKKTGGFRKLGIPTVSDRIAQTVVKLIIEPILDRMFHPDSYGYRPGNSAKQAVAVTRQRCWQYDWVVEFDIKAAFDKISQKWMLQNICTDTKVLEKWLRAGFVEKNKLFPTAEGCPQGGIISPVVANMVLDGLEDLLGAFYGSKKIDGNQNRTCINKVHFVRYADDFVITGHSKELLENEVKPLVREFLAERGLELSEEKTKVTHIAEGFDFLGQNVRKYRLGKPNEKLLIKPARKSVKAFLEQTRATIRALKSAQQATVIQLLNPRIIGWANYHCHVVAKQIFSKIDNSIWHALWNWARRRHRNKNRHWIFSRYFHGIGNRNNVFGYKVVQEDGSEKQACLKIAADVPIKRHVKIQGPATPFDPFYEEYFEKRDAMKMESHLEGHRKLLYIWTRQKGLCPICAEKITKESGWHLHHLVRRVDGGSDRCDNLCLLHPVCHMQGHSSGFRFVLPVGPENPT